MKPLLLVFIALGISLSSCNTKNKTSNDEIRQIIIEKYKIMRPTLKNGDPTYVINMHTHDAILFQQNGKEVSGIVALTTFYKKIATLGIDIISKPTTLSLLSDDVAFEVGTFVSISKTGVQDSAKYINIWKKVDGDWKIQKAIDQAKL